MPRSTTPQTHIRAPCGTPDPRYGLFSLVPWRELRDCENMRSYKIRARSEESQLAELPMPFAAIPSHQRQTRVMFLGPCKYCSARAVRLWKDSF